MSSAQSAASQQALQTNQGLESSYYGLAIPSLYDRQQSINTSLSKGESSLMSSAFGAQRASMTDSISANAQAGAESSLAGNKQAIQGGNTSLGLEPSDIGATLANALYGSKFQEGQANIGQQMNLMNMALGGAGQSGNAGLSAAGSQLGAIQYMPQYNQGLATASGIGSGLGTLYGAYNNWQLGQQTQAKIDGGSA